MIYSSIHFQVTKKIVWKITLATEASLLESGNNKRTNLRLESNSP